MEPVRIENGLVQGIQTAAPDGTELRTYRGIPYGASTAGKNRWKPPQPAESWEGVLDCSSYGDAAPQEPPGFPYPYEKRSEDCLNLNIVTPATSPGDKLPVMVWFHGGGYTAGCANNDFYNSVRLASHGVVLVTVNHRLNVFGLMAHPLLTAESPHHSSGNYLFLDLIASLRWVQKNIGVFGGDPGNVTIFGESGGGGKVSTLMTVPLAKGLFHRAICESGTSVTEALFGSSPLQELEANGEKLFRELGVDTAADPLEAARKIPWREVTAAEQKVTAAEQEVRALSEGEERRIFSLWDAAVDGWILPDSPTGVFDAGSHNAVPLICGANVGELYSGMVVMPWVIPGYCRQVEGNNRAGSRGFMYIFNKVPPGWKKAGLLACHTLELHYLLGLDEDEWEHILPGPPNPKPLLDEADDRVSEAMRCLWTQFARTGDPNVPGRYEWPAWERDTDSYLYITDPPGVRSGFSQISEKNAANLES